MRAMRAPSVMTPQALFARVPKAEIERSQFDRSHGCKTTFNEGLLIPVYVDEALPGDTFHMRMSGFARLSTPIKPLMDNIYLDTFFFAVPYRLVWSHWVNMHGEQANPGDSTSYTIPQLTAPAAGGFPEGSLEDYFGLPTKINSIAVSVLWHRAYYKIWNEWFRDENLQTRATPGDDMSDGPVGPATFTVYPRNKRPDYYTTCLPWPQKSTGVAIPLSTALVVPYPNVHTAPTFWNQTSATNAGSMVRTGAGNPSTLQVNTAGAAGEVVGWNDPHLAVDLSAAGGTINSLRQAFQIQKMLEKDARGGTRYIEMVRQHFGVTSPDARLQRPEYLGGGTAAMIVSPIAQNSATAITGGGAGTPATPQGNLSGIGTVAFQGHGFVKSFTEHCLLLGFVAARADLLYQQGMDRMWSRLTRWDFFYPSLAHLGEQAVYNKEIYCDGTGNDALVFGYQERFGEYRFKISHVTGQFRSNAATPLDYWHLSQKFLALPTLGDVFIREPGPAGASSAIARAVAVPSEPHFLGDFWFNLICARPMPVISVPGLVDHF